MKRVSCHSPACMYPAKVTKATSKTNDQCTNRSMPKNLPILKRCENNYKLNALRERRTAYFMVSGLIFRNHSAAVDLEHGVHQQAIGILRKLHIGTTKPLQQRRSVADRRTWWWLRSIQRRNGNLSIHPGVAHPHGPTDHLLTGQRLILLDQYVITAERILKLAANYLSSDRFASSVETPNWVLKMVNRLAPA